MVHLAATVNESSSIDTFIHFIFDLQPFKCYMDWTEWKGRLAELAGIRIKKRSRGCGVKRQYDSDSDIGCAVDNQQRLFSYWHSVSSFWNGVFVSLSFHLFNKGR